MEEFKRISWTCVDLSHHANASFIPDDIISQTYIQKNLDQPLKHSKKLEKFKKLKYSNEMELNEYKPILRKSLLNSKQKETCLKALKLFHSGKDLTKLTTYENYCIEIYKKFQAKINEENQRFLYCANVNWNNKIKKSNSVNNDKFGIFFWTENCKRFLQYPQFYKEKAQISLAFNELESSVHYECIQVALEVGKLAKYSQPNLKVRHILRNVTLPKLHSIPTINSQLPVSQDKNIEDILQKFNTSAVISSSGLNQIINCDVKSEWILPVVVKMVNGKKVIFIDKKLPKTNPNVCDFKNFKFKKMLKENFCRQSAFDFPSCDISINTNIEKEINKDQPVYSNAVYRIWKIRRTNNLNNLMKNRISDSEINLLIRTKLDACEKNNQNALQPVILEPKVEYQLTYGAGLPSKGELARQWTMLFFRPFSNLYRVRISNVSKSVVAIDKCDLQKINTEAFTHHKYKPHLGLGVLENILAELTKLDCNNYLLLRLQKHEGFVCLMENCAENDPNAYNLHAKKEDCKFIPCLEKTWTPIDVNYILPVHEQYQQLPGMFAGFDFNCKSRKLKIRKGTKKKNKKKKNCF